MLLAIEPIAIKLCQGSLSASLYFENLTVKRQLLINQRKKNKKREQQDGLFKEAKKHNTIKRVWALIRTLTIAKMYILGQAV